GRSALGMASQTFYFLGPDDLARLIAHLRRAPDEPPIPRERYVSFRGRIGLALGMLQTSADAVDRGRPRWGALPGRRRSSGGGTSQASPAPSATASTSRETNMRERLLSPSSRRTHR